MKTGWSWKETAHGNIFFNNRKTYIGESELSKRRLESFGDIGPWRNFIKEVEVSFQEMKESDSPS